MFNIILRIEAIQKKDQTDYSSFFQLAGIHGLPFTTWAKPPNTPAPPYESGYCTHSQILFPTWHRVYVSIYEVCFPCQRNRFASDTCFLRLQQQILQEEAKEIAKRFTADKQQWAQAAEDLRQPYWDTGFALVPPDEVIKLEQVQIIDYGGSKVSVKNPILRYHFHPIDPSFKGYPNYETWNTTVRNPDANKKEDIPGLIAWVADTVLIYTVI
jgi:tyrosinase